MKIRKTTAAIAWIMITISLASLKASEVDYYEEGLALMKQEQWEQALQKWWLGKTLLEQKNEVDPRLGIAFIEFVTTNNMVKYFGTASDLYLWGMASDDNQKYLQAVLEEAARVKPLLPEETQKEWNRRIQKQDPTLAQSIRRYWLERDPRPITPGNERLIEHWQRIALARREFRKNSNCVYGCDDRGLIYVRYGEPKRRKDGHLGNSSASLLELGRWLGFSRLVEMDQAEARARANFIGGSNHSTVAVPQEDINMMNIKLWDPNPEYEVWLYDNIREDKPVVFLFSREKGTGPFGLIDGVEMALPRMQGRSANTYMPRLRNAIYQIVYYAELMSFDESFASRYKDIETVWERAANSDRMPDSHEVKILNAFYHHNLGEDKFNHASKYAVADKSDYEDLTGKILMQAQTYRFLDKSNEPKLLVFASSSPQIQGQFLVPDGTGQVGLPDYHLRHSLILRDDNLNDVYRMNDEMPGGENNLSAFQMAHIHQKAHFTLAAEAIYQEDTTNTINNEFFPSILAIGNESFHVDPPLSRNEANLELSDLVLGVDLPQNTRIGDLPLPVIPAKTFAPADPVKLYLEMYHLFVDQQGNGQGQVEYVVSQHRDDGKRSKALISSSFRFHSDGRSGKEVINLDISRLRRGDYEFTVTVTDLLSNDKMSRTALFTVK